MANQYSKSRQNRLDAIENGKKYYESETPCKVCGSKEKYTKNSSCRPCTLKKSKGNLYDAELMGKYRTKEKKAKWLRENEERRVAIQRRYQLKQYGITENDYQKMLAEQKGVCKICGVEETVNLSVDHCHTTGTVRGLLCKKCNVGIGYFKDNPDTLAKAIEYLQGKENP